jgi:glycosyltransferase involved in cell wall biosynthesis
MSELKKLSENSKTKIVFHGWVNNQSEEYKEILGSSSIFCLVSEKENSSISLLESMSAGCAIITSDISGCPETIDKSGICIPAKNPSILYEKLKELVENPKKIKSLGESARIRVIKTYDWDVLINSYFRLFK